MYDTAEPSTSLGYISISEGNRNGEWKIRNWQSEQFGFLLFSYLSLKPIPKPYANYPLFLCSTQLYRQVLPIHSPFPTFNSLSGGFPHLIGAASPSTSKAKIFPST